MNNIIKIVSGGLDFEYEIIKSNAPIEEIEKAIIYQETGYDPDTGNQKAYFEYLEQKEFYCEPIDSNIYTYEITEHIDFTVDIADCMKKYGYELITSTNNLYLYEKVT